MEMYNIMSNNCEQPISTVGGVCSVCLNQKPITIEFELDNKMNFFCGEPCFVAFKFVNNITPGKCDMCRKYFDNTLLEEHSIYYDNAQHRFCSRICQNIYIIYHRKSVACSLCKVQKYNFDMIKRNSSFGLDIICSFNCLNLALVSANAVKRLKCDHCQKNLQAQYCLTMSDVTIRNLCSNTCVMEFQNQFPQPPLPLEFEDCPVPVLIGAPKRSEIENSRNTESLMAADIPPIPVVRSVQSITTTNGPKPVFLRLIRYTNNSDAADKATAISPPVKTQIKQQIIIKPAPLPPQRNIAAMYKACNEVQTVTEETVDDPQPIHHLMERQAVRGRKRLGRPPKSASNKRGRCASNTMDLPMMPPPQPPPPPEPAEKPYANMCLKYTYGVNSWKQWVTTKNAELEKSSRHLKLFKPAILQLTIDELNYSLCLFVKEVRKPNGQEYAPDIIYYLCLGIQKYLFEHDRIANIFCDTYYEKFTDCLDDVAKKFSALYNDSHYIVTHVEEEHLWESKQLGAYSPYVLLFTLMYFNTKHFDLTTVDKHMQLSFSYVMKVKRNPNQPDTNKVAGSRNVFLGFYPPQTAADANGPKKKVYEQQENEENPLRCPVKLYEFYVSKCPESVRTTYDIFYLLPESTYIEDSPAWYSNRPLSRYALEKMLHRIKMVKEINVALLTS